MKSKKLIYLVLLFILFNYSLSGSVEIIKEDSKYENEKYINFFRIPKDMMEPHTNAGEFHKVDLAFDDDYNSF